MAVTETRAADPRIVSREAEAGIQGSGRVSVGIIGYGAIGGEVAGALRRGEVAGHDLVAVLAADVASSVAERVEALEELLEVSDLVIEAAGQGAVREYAHRVVARGTDLVLVSVGALVDHDLRAQLERGPGRVRVPSGAVGGLDALRAAIADDGLDEVRLTTRKPPGSVLQSWMTAEHRDELLGAEHEIVAFDGMAADAVVAFPASVNVAATLALATLGFERTRVRVLADPACASNQHVIEASGPVGDYRFEFDNRPSSSNPRTSALTARSVVSVLRQRAATLTIGS